MTVRFLRPLARLVATFWAFPLAAHAAEIFVYFGTTNERKTSEGIYVSRFDTETGTLSPAVLAAKIESPMFINFHPTKPLLYAIGEEAAPHGKTLGRVEVFTIDPATGRLTTLNRQPSGGDALCYVLIDATGRTALAASYREGFVTTFPLQTDGRLQAHTSLIRHSGTGVNLQRQERPHAHCIDLDPANRFALAADLGIDQVISYRLDPAAGTISQQPNPFKVQPGSGPRHLAFDPAGRHVYIVNELSSTITTASYDSEHGTLTEQQTLPLVPSDFKGVSTAAEVVVHPSGRFLYASNRGHDSLALFAISPDTGLLTFVEYMREGISHPRHFAIDPTGNWLLCGNRDADMVTVYRIDSTTGHLTKAPASVKVPMPTCVKFLSIKP